MGSILRPSRSSPISGLNSRFWATLILAVFSPGWVEANGPPIHGDTAFVVGIEGAGVRSFYQERRMSKLLQDGVQVPDPQDRHMIVRMVPFMLPYEAIPNRLVVGLMVPYFDKRLERTISGQRAALTNRGLGDVTTFGKVQFYQHDRPGGTTRITGKLGLKLPTGKDDARDETGTLLPPSLQLGSGSWDVSPGMVLTHLYQRWGLNANAVYDFNTQANNFKRGDVLRYDLAGAMRLLPLTYERYPTPQLNLIVELNGVITRKDEVREVKDPNSGGHALLFSPGL
ncbi:MAG: transporter, partial [Elusimicrobia bacterium]|nr:transporter [Elusimicrobiota bacterium]